MRKCHKKNMNPFDECDVQNWLRNQFHSINHEAKFNRVIFSFQFSYDFKQRKKFEQILWMRYSYSIAIFIYSSFVIFNRATWTRFAKSLTIGIFANRKNFRLNFIWLPMSSEIMWTPTSSWDYFFFRKSATIRWIKFTKKWIWSFQFLIDSVYVYVLNVICFSLSNQ